MEYYTINKYLYIDKESKMKMVIFAREDETARQMVEIANTEENDFHWVQYKRFFKPYKKEIVINVPPYELEQEQFECLNKELEQRKQYNRQTKKD